MVRPIMSAAECSGWPYVRVLLKASQRLKAFKVDAMVLDEWLATRKLRGICPENGKITSEDAVNRDSVSDDGV
jgi:hypothetical protein